MTTSQHDSSPERLALTMSDGHRDALRRATDKRTKAITKAQQLYEKATAPHHRRRVTAIEAANTAYDADVAAILADASKSEAR